MTYDVFYQSLLQPQFIRYGPNFYGAHFSLMKIVPADFIVRALIRSNKLPSYVIETSSGTAALGLAYACQRYGLRLVIVGDYAITGTLKAKLEALGVEPQLVPAEAGNQPGGFQKARLDRLMVIMRERPGGIWVEQYHNPQWALAYRNLAATLVREFGRVAFLVAATGSGASSGGTVAGLRLANAECRCAAVDTVGSVLFGSKEAPRRLRGPGLSIIPKNLEHTAYDDVFWVTARFAWTAAHQLFRLHGSPWGPTTGASWSVARIIARAYPDQLVVFIGPDDTSRYDMLFTESTLRSEDLWIETLPDTAKEVGHPRLVTLQDDLQHYQWGRRSLEQVASL